MEANLLEIYPKLPCKLINVKKQGGIKGKDSVFVLQV